MPRPPKNSAQPSADVRMIDAFWQLLAEKSFGAITVKDIVTRAHVNRNSFYYHFTGIMELADAAVRREITDCMSAFAIALLSPEQGAFKRLSAGADEELPLDKIKLLTGKNSTTALIQNAKEAVLTNALAAFDLTIDDLSLSDQVSIRFILAGVIDLWGSADELYGKDALTIKTLFETAIVKSNIAVVRKILASHRTVEANEA